MVDFHQLRTFQRILFKSYGCLRFQVWFVGSGTITEHYDHFDQDIFLIIILFVSGLSSLICIQN